MQTHSYELHFSLRSFTLQELSEMFKFQLILGFEAPAEPRI